MTARRSCLFAVAMLAMLALAVPALAHVERTAYWPDPAPDTSVTPPAGGSVPKARSLASGLKRVKGTRVRVRLSMRRRVSLDRQMRCGAR